MMMAVRTLQKRADFLQLKAEGKRVFRPAFVMQWLPLDGRELRVGYTASGKAIGNAVKRNRARRRLKAAVDEVLRLNPAVAEQDGRKIALIAKPAVLEQPYAGLLEDLRSAVSAAGVSL